MLPQLKIMQSHLHFLALAMLFSTDNISVMVVCLSGAERIHEVEDIIDDLFSCISVDALIGDNKLAKQEEDLHDTVIIEKGEFIDDPVSISNDVKTSTASSPVSQASSRKETRSVRWRAWRYSSRRGGSKKNMSNPHSHSQKAKSDGTNAKSTKGSLRRSVKTKTPKQEQRPQDNELNCPVQKEQKSQQLNQTNLSQTADQLNGKEQLKEGDKMTPHDTRDDPILTMSEQGVVDVDV